MNNIDLLPAPQAQLWDWQLHGACRGTQSEIFYHPEGERGLARRSRERKAKEICALCPVMRNCRQHSLQYAEPYGIWGGLSESERAALLGQRTS